MKPATRSLMMCEVFAVMTAGSDWRRIRHIGLVIAAGGHLATRRHMEEVAGEVVPPGAGLAERRESAQDQPRVLFAQGLVPEPEGFQEAGPEGFQNDVRCR